MSRLATLRTDSPPSKLKADPPRDTDGGGAALAAGRRGAAGANATEGYPSACAPKPKRKIRRRSLTPRINQVRPVLHCCVAASLHTGGIQRVHQCRWIRVALVVP